MPGLFVTYSLSYVHFLVILSSVFSFQYTFEACETIWDVPEPLNEYKFDIRGCDPAILILSPEEHAQTFFYVYLKMDAATPGMK